MTSPYLEEPVFVGKKKLLTKKVKYIQSFWELHNQENKHWKKLILFYRYFTGKWGLKKKCIS